MGILLALYTEVPQEEIDLYASLFVAARVAYVALYIGDQDKLRSIAWLVGVICSVGLYIASMGSMGT